jgi:hypothetical protein
MDTRVKAVSFPNKIHNRSFSLFKADILQVTKCCPNLEHLTIHYLYEASLKEKLNCGPEILCKFYHIPAFGDLFMRVLLGKCWH